MKLIVTSGGKPYEAKSPGHVGGVKALMKLLSKPGYISVGDNEYIAHSAIEHIKLIPDESEKKQLEVIGETVELD